MFATQSVDHLYDHTCLLINLNESLQQMAHFLNYSSHKRTCMNQTQLSQKYNNIVKVHCTRLNKPLPSPTQWKSPVKGVEFQKCECSLRSLVAGCLLDKLALCNQFYMEW